LAHTFPEQQASVHDRYYLAGRRNKRIFS